MKLHRRFGLNWNLIVFTIATVVFMISCFKGNYSNNHLWEYLAISVICWFNVFWCCVIDISLSAFYQRWIVANAAFNQVNELANKMVKVIQKMQCRKKGEPNDDLIQEYHDLIDEIRNKKDEEQ